MKSGGVSFSPNIGIAAFMTARAPRAGTRWVEGVPSIRAALDRTDDRNLGDKTGARARPRILGWQRSHCDVCGREECLVAPLVARRRRDAIRRHRARISGRDST